MSMPLLESPIVSEFREPSLAEEILVLVQHEEATRAELKERGELSGGYHVELEAVHLANAVALERIIDEFGWPGISLVGPEASAAAWQIAIDAISLPPFQLWCLEQLEEAVANGDALAKHHAIFFDRIRFNQRQPQRYGTILDWDESGRLNPWKIEHPELVDELRAQVGLERLGLYIARLRFAAEMEGDTPSKDYQTRISEVDDWARSVGWIAD